MFRFVSIMVQQRGASSFFYHGATIMVQLQYCLHHVIFKLLKIKCFVSWCNKFSLIAPRSVIMVQVQVPLYI